LTGMPGLTGRLGASGAVGWPSGGHGAAQAAAAAGGRRRGEARRCMAASGGALRLRGKDAPNDAGIAPGRPRALGETSGDPPGRRQRRTTAHGEPRRRFNSGEGEPATRSAEVQPNSTDGLLTSRRIQSATPRRASDGGGTGSRRRRGPRQRRR
jgi:hypothetical protein